VPRAKRSQEQVAEVQRVVAEHRGNQKAAAAELGMSPANVHATLKQAAQPVETASGSGDTCEVTKTTAERVRTLDDLIRVCEIDTVEWTVERWVCNKWDSAAKLGKDEAERIALTELFQVKVWLRRNVRVLAARDEIDALIARGQEADQGASHRQAAV
jgi:hypothetical protein